jgi:DUF1365 family protein
MSSPAAHLYHGAVTHRRLRPIGHAFSYRVFSMLIDVDRIGEIDEGSRWFSRGRFNLFSFHDADHAFSGCGTVAAGMRALLKSQGYRADGRILLLCYPRILGYVFNPLSIFYCENAQGRLEAVLYEVRNTFGGRHSYLLPVEDGAGVIRQTADKKLRVSPFMDMDQNYAFKLSRPGETLSVFIHQTDRDGPIFNAAFSARAEAMTDAALMRAFFRYPLMTLKIIAAIHVEAGRLLLKGVRLKGRVADPQDQVTAKARTKALAGR